MDKRTWIIGGVIALLLVGIAPTALATEEGSAVDEFYKIVKDVQSRLDELSGKQEAYERDMEAVNARLDAGHTRISNVIGKLDYVDGRLITWMSVDKADIAELFNRVEALEQGTPAPTPSAAPPRSGSFTGQVRDDAPGKARGWDPDDQTRVFTIIDSRVTDKSVITTTLNWGDTQCFVRGLLTDETQEKGFSLACDGPVSEGASLNYQLVNPIKD